MTSVSQLAAPANWHRVRVDEVCTIKSGSTPLRSKHERYFTNGTIPWVKTMDLTNGLVFETDELITEEALKESSCPLLDPGTVLVAMYGGFNQIGRTGLMTFRGSVNQAISALITDPDQITPEYLLHWLNASVATWKRIAASSRKDPNITGRDVAGFPVLLPPLPEQRKIAEILGTWDAAIGRVEQLIAALQRRKQGLMQRLLTGAVRFPEFVGTEWEECCIGDLLTEVKRPLKLESDKNYSLASVRRRSEGLFFREQRPGRELTSSEMYEVHTGDFLISKRQIVHGASALVTSEFDGFLVSNSYHVLSARDRMDIRYFNWLSKTPLMYHYSYVASHGVHIEKLFFILETYFQQRVVVPTSPDEQRKIASVLDSADEQIQKYRLYLAQLQAQKKGLMQRLLTGQVRVKVDSITPTA